MKLSLLLLSAASLFANDKADVEKRLNQEIFKRTSVQIALIEERAKSIASPIVQEREVARKALCEAAKITIDQCIIDSDTGVVTDKGTPSNAGK